MKVIVLGGAGDVGSRAVEDLAVSPSVDAITIADRNVARARQIAGELRGRGARAEISVREIDANDHDALIDAIRGHDVAASALGPFARYERRLAEAALDAGCDYASVCDEWDAAEPLFAELGERARREGRTIITGLGVSPGFSNLGIRLAAASMDRVRRADVLVYQPLDAGGGEAVIRHMLHIMTGKAAGWRGGRRVLLPACSESRVVEFPRYGAIRVWNMGHAEPVTVPRYLEGIEEVNFFMGYGPGSRLLVAPARLGLFARPWLTDGVVSLLVRAARKNAGEPAWGAIRVDIEGEQDGRPLQRMLCGVGQMRDSTGLSLSVGTQMLGTREGLVSSAGVFAPEGCLDAAIFLERCREKGLVAYEDLEMTRTVGATGATASVA